MQKLTLLLSLLVALFFIGCDNDGGDGEKQAAPKVTTYTGTLTVLQKDAYSTVAGRSMGNLWPPHTTTVFQWDEDSIVQLNHGTAPGAKDAAGNEILVLQKTYTFTGTKAEMQALAAEYRKATIDSLVDHDTLNFLGLETGETALARSVLTGLKAYLDTTTTLTISAQDKKDMLTAFEKSDMKTVAPLLLAAGWSAQSFISALQQIFIGLGENVEDYHVCNNDADLQINLIKNYVATGNIEMPAPTKGPMVLYVVE